MAPWLKIDGANLSMRPWRRLVCRLAILLPLVGCVYLLIVNGLHINLTDRETWAEETSLKFADTLFYKQILDTQMERKNNIENVCKTLNGTKELTISKFAHNLVDDDRKYIYCKIYKVASSSMKKFLANSTEMSNFTNNSELKINSNTFLSKMGMKSFRKNSFELILYRLINYFKFVIVRHPLRRLFSAYQDKFLGTHPDNVRSFQRPMGRHIMKKYRKNATKQELETGRNVTFAEFLRYVIETRNRPNGHWRTYLDNCQPCLMHFDFVAKLETLKTDFKYILSQVPHKEAPLPTNRPPDPRADEIFRERIRSVPNDVMRQILAIYRWDFLIFGYDITLKDILGEGHGVE